ncbi:MAG: sugar phosphate isomerase/epimerase [Glaciecola sp.]|jgi:sugar phosphate isomerase/epimerase
MNRLMTTFLCGISLVTAMSLQAHEHLIGSELKHNIGIQLYSLRNQIKQDTDSAFKQIHDWNIMAVEGGRDLNGLTIDEYKSFLKQHDLQLVSVDTNYEELRDNPIAAVYKARFYDSKFTTFYWIPHGESGEFTIEHAKAAVAVLNDAGKLLKQHGIVLQYHAHGYEFSPYKDGTVFDYMVQNTQYAQFQMDVFWIANAGVEPLKLLQKYPGRFSSFHLKDRAEDTIADENGLADTESNVALGKGNIDITGVVKEAKKQGVNYFFLEDESSRVISQVPVSILFYNNI